MITWHELENCLAEADRFTKKALAAQERIKENSKFSIMKHWQVYSIAPSAETAAVRRASLDLTMALRKLRERV